jgi:hypothetical protein
MERRDQFVTQASDFKALGAILRAPRNRRRDLRDATLFRQLRN